MIQYAVGSSHHSMESEHHKTGISLIKAPAVTIRPGVTGNIYGSGLHKMWYHSLCAMSVNNNYFSGTAIAKTLHYCSKISHKVLTCLDVQGGIFFPGLGKLVHAAYPFKVSLNEDFYLSKRSRYGCNK